MAPAFSYTAGTIKNSDKIIFYALHYDSKKMNHGEFGHTEVWKSEDQGATWAKIADPIITDSGSGIKPSYSTICCSEFNAAKAYLVCNRYRVFETGIPVIYVFTVYSPKNIIAQRLPFN